VGRTNKILFKYRLRFKIPDSALIGAGQFGTTTISYFLYAKFKNRFKYVYDIDKSRSTKYVNIYPNTNQVEEIETILNDKDIRYVFIASNHFSHTNYAIEFLTKGIDVYCEKPISVTFDQFDTLLDAIKKSNAAFYAGYNRPFSSAIETLKKSISGSKNIDGKFSLNCFVSAHDIPKDHWYRKEEEGTRICGNAGHWIDLMIHLFNIRGSIPKSYEVQIAYSDTKESDDNIVICITTPLGDLTSITITARSEPFEGINETINLQYDKVIVKIDDFRSVIIWDDDKLYRKKYRIKDVGHKRSVMQPFVSEKRDLNEVIASTELMLHIADMVKVAEKNKKIELFRSL
jgi:predicted dehydrogenase